MLIAKLAKVGPDNGIVKHIKGVQQPLSVDGRRVA
jgi:hypothetical protein